LIINKLMRPIEAWLMQIRIKVLGIQN